MKKVLAVLLATTLAFGMLAGCKKNEAEGTTSSGTESGQTQPGAVYKDGEYSATYSVMALDRTLDYLTVKVQGDKFEIVEYGASEDKSMPESDPAATSSDADTGEATEAEKRVREYMVKILESYDTAGQKVDEMVPVVGANEHYGRFVRMMREIEKSAKAGDTTAISLKPYADGSYKATMPAADESGWTAYVEATVADGEITKLAYDATKDGKKISEDADAKVGDAKAGEVYTQIQQACIDAGYDLSKVFAPTGAAVETRTFIKLMAPLLDNMVSGGAQEITAPNYVNGTYRAEFADFDESGWKEYLVIDVVNDQVYVQEFDAIHKDDEKKMRSEDEASETKMKESTGTYTYVEAAEMLAKDMESKNDIFGVENVAGATVTSNNFKVLMANLLACSASEGDTQTVLKVDRYTSEKA